MATAIETIQTPRIQHTECFIDGKWLPAASGKTFATINPATEESIAEVAEGAQADIDLAIRASLSNRQSSTV